MHTLVWNLLGTELKDKDHLELTLFFLFYLLNLDTGSWKDFPHFS